MKIALSVKRVKNVNVLYKKLYEDLKSNSQEMDAAINQTDEYEIQASSKACGKSIDIPFSKKLAITTASNRSRMIDRTKENAPIALKKIGGFIF